MHPFRVFCGGVLIAYNMLGVNVKRVDPIHKRTKIWEERSMLTHNYNHDKCNQGNKLQAH